MRAVAAIVLLASTGWAQFKSTVPLVLAPTTVTDSKGHYVDGLTTDDLILYDNNVPQTIQMDWMTYPIDLVVAVQTSANSGAVIDKLGGSGILFADLLAANAGQTAIIRIILRRPAGRVSSIERAWRIASSMCASLPSILNIWREWVTASGSPVKF